MKKVIPIHNYKAAKESLARKKTATEAASIEGNIVTRSQKAFDEEMIAIISAYRYNLSEEMNEKRNRMLANQLQALGLGFRTNAGIWVSKNGLKGKEKSLLVNIRYGANVGCKIDFEEFCKIMQRLAEKEFRVTGDEESGETQFYQDAYIVKEAGNDALLIYTDGSKPTKNLGNNMTINQLTDELIKAKVEAASEEDGGWGYTILGYRKDKKEFTPEEMAKRLSEGKGSGVKGQRVVIESTGYSDKDETNCSGPLRGTTESIRKLRKKFISD